MMMYNQFITPDLYYQLYLSYGISDSLGQRISCSVFISFIQSLQRNTFLSYLFLGCPIGLLSLNWIVMPFSISMLCFPFPWPYDWLRAEWPRGWSSSPGRIKNYLFFTSSRPALGPTQPPMK
jgi:hypothetical protein